MGKPAGKTGKGSAGHDHRFDDNDPIDGSFCKKCYRPCIPHSSRMCRSCRPAESSVHRWTPVQEARVDAQLDEFIATERAIETENGCVVDPPDIVEARAALEKAKQELRAEVANASVFRHTKIGAGRRPGLSETEKANTVAEREARAARAAEKIDYGEAVCLLKACSKTFPRKRLLQECCSKKCAQTIEKMRFKVRAPVRNISNEGTGAGVGSGASMPSVPEDRSAPQGPAPRPGAPPDAPDAGRVESREETGPERSSSGVLEAVRVEVAPAEDGEEVAMAATKTERASRFTEAQIKWADEQNRPPHNRSHADIGGELKTTQAHLSRMLRDYRDRCGLDTPDVVANRRAAAGDKPKAEKPKKKTAPKKAKRATKATKEPKEPKLKCVECEGYFPRRDTRLSDGDRLCKWCKKDDEEDMKKDKKASKTTELAKRPTGKIVGVSLEGVVADAERAKGELDTHHGACPDCAGKVSSNEMCMLGRAFASRWARLEFIAVSA